MDPLAPYYEGKIRKVLFVARAEYAEHRVYGIDADRNLVVTTDECFVGSQSVGNVHGRSLIITRMARFWRDNPALAGATNLLPDNLPAWAEPQRTHAVVVSARAGVERVQWWAYSNLVGGLWREYSHYGTINGQRAPVDMYRYQELPEPVIVPSVGGTEQEETPVTFGQAAALIGAERATRERDFCRNTYQAAAEVARSKGVEILGNECGVGWLDGKPVLCGHVFTPSIAWLRLAEPVRSPAVAIVEQDRLAEWASQHRLIAGQLPPLPGWLVRLLRVNLAELCRRLTGDSPF